METLESTQGTEMSAPEAPAATNKEGTKAPPQVEKEKGESSQ